MRRSMLMLLAVLPSTGALAQTPPRVDASKYPSKVVRMTVGYAAGGAVDVSARILAQKMMEVLGQNVVVENRPGADGNLASDLVAKSPPDGHTLAYVSAGHTMNPAMYPKSLPYQIGRAHV